MPFSLLLFFFFFFLLMLLCYLFPTDPPVCKSESTIIRAALKQTINITCQVDANPLDNLNYKWHFNNSLESLIELPNSLGGGGVVMGLTAGGGGGHHSQQQMLLHADASHASAGYYQRSKRKHLHGQQHEAKLAHGRHGRMAMRTIVHQQQQQQSLSHMEAWSNIQFEDDDVGAGDYVEQPKPLHRHRPHYHNVDDHHHADDDDDDDGGDEGHGDVVVDDRETDEAINGVYGRTNSEDLPYTQMVYSNMIYKNHLDGKQHSTGTATMGGVGGSGTGLLNGKQPTQYQTLHHQQQQMRSQPLHEAAVHSNQYQQLAERKRLAALHKQQHHRLAMATTTTTAAPVPLNNVYSYHIESYESFGAISCVASSPMGQSQPCWYHIQPAGKFPKGERGGVV